jgi:hypothetical protein
MKKSVWIVLGLLVTSLLFGYTVLARLPANQTASRGIYIQFDNVFDNIDRTHGYPVAGGHQRWQWKDLEPSYDNDYQFDSQIRTFVTQQDSRGKKAALGIETFVGRINQSPPYGSLAVPQWLWGGYPDVAVWNPRGSEPHWYTLDYLSANYQNKYAEFVRAFADWLAANPDVAENVAWVEIGVGMYSETQPSDEWVTQNWPDFIFYSDDPPYGLGYTSSQWQGYVNWCTDLYYDAFRVRNPGLSHIALFLNCAPDFKGSRTAFTDYAGSKGVGLKNNGLQVDRHPYYLYEPLAKWGAVTAPGTVPIAWETYEQWLTNEAELYWGLLCALDKLPDVLEPDRWLMLDHNKNPRPNYIAIWNWVEQYVGVTPSTTPGIWCAMRETEFGNGEPGNFNFWLFERTSLAGGTTVAEWNVTSAKEGRYTKRTDQATGNPYMNFQVLNPSTFYASPGTVTVRVVYLDRGTDSLKLRYDSFTGEKDAWTIQKTNTDTWREKTVVLTDARFGNGVGPGGTGTSPDLKIDCMSDGNEWIHIVEVKKGSGGPTPTPTQTPIACTIQGSVTLQRPNKPAPDPSWVVPLTVSVGGSSHSATTDQSGNFTVTGLTAGTYNIRVKNSHTLANLKSAVTLVPGTNSISFGTLLEGDANDDNCVNITDFSVLRGGFVPGYDARADFNQDGFVNITDFSLLKSNFATCGDIPVAGPPESAGAQEAGTAESADGTVQVSIEPASSSVSTDEVFAVNIQLAAGAQLVDGAEVHLDFDPTYLQVVDGSGNPTAEIEPGTALDVALLNGVDNAQGQIDYAAGTFGGAPSGTFVLATVRFKALRGTGGTSVTFVDRGGSPTNVTYAGESVLGGTNDGLVRIGGQFQLFLPVITSH